MSTSGEETFSSTTTTIKIVHNEDNSKKELLNDVQNVDKKGDENKEPVRQQTETNDLPKRGMFQNLRRTVENFLPNFTKSNGRRNNCKYKLTTFFLKITFCLHYFFAK